MPPSPKGPGLEEDAEVKERHETAVPKRYMVIFHNDDFTTQEFVVEALQRFFHKTETEAVHIMLTVHMKGTRGRRSLYARCGRDEGRRGHRLRPAERAPTPFDGRAGVKKNA